MDDRLKCSGCRIEEREEKARGWTHEQAPFYSATEYIFTCPACRREVHTIEAWNDALKEIAAHAGNMELHELRASLIRDAWHLLSFAYRIDGAAVKGARLMSERKGKGTILKSTSSIRDAGSLGSLYRISDELEEYMKQIDTDERGGEDD